MLSLHRLGLTRRPHNHEAPAKKILELLHDEPDGLTCEEIEDALRMRHQTASARLNEMVRDRNKKGEPVIPLVRRYGVRINSSGRFASVWFITGAGITLLRTGERP